MELWISKWNWRFGSGIGGLGSGTGGLSGGAYGKILNWELGSCSIAWKVATNCKESGKPH